MMNKTLGLYFHIPFCSCRCDYCNFYSSIYKEDIAKAYVDALCEEIRLVSEKFNDRIVDTIYIGGGTPSVLDTGLIDKIIATVYKHYNCNIIESTIELNPNDYQKIPKLSYMGFNRISIGVQTFNTDLLQKVGRQQNPLIAVRALDAAARHFKNISGDIILGINERQDVKYDLQTMFKYVTHLSAYLLKVENGTILKERIDSKNVAVATDNATVKQYYDMYSFAIKNHFAPYEVSNFALLGCESKHNMKYWDMSEYIGFGASAHSYTNGIRYYNIDDLYKYIAGEHAGYGKEIMERAYSIEDEMMEMLMLALRTTSGLDINAFNKKFNCDFLKDNQTKLKLIEGAVTLKNGRLSIKPKFLLVMNTIIADLL